ncbi:hypothetical protein [Nocardioides ferulae]|uniref:hypothetical protein n=1 Tax=Nocardioides ferulae TaxID=2340821 RepID=UPI000EABFB29|nr:hypothetical protein [Nocardioides ferulae]
MATYDADLQAAVDATSVAKDAGEVEPGGLADYLRRELAEREIETSDDAWVQMVVENIERDPNFMVDTEPSDYTSPERGQES